MSGGRTRFLDHPLIGFFGIYLLVMAFVALVAAVADSTGLGLPLSFLIIGVACFCLAFGSAHLAQWVKRQKRCPHGVRAGLYGRCGTCRAAAQAELDQVRREANGAARERSRRLSIEKEAQRLRGEEIARLSKAWLSNTEAYLTMPPRHFEIAIAELFRRLGYSVEQTPYSNDGGKDAIAKKDGKKYLIECKCYGERHNVGRRELQILVAAIQEERADGGIYVTTSAFARTAEEYAAKNKIELYDRRRLPPLVNSAYRAAVDYSTAQIMCLECGSIVPMPVEADASTGTCPNGHPITSNIVKAHLDMPSSSQVPYCDRCGSPMQIVTRYSGPFWGCSRFPNCKATKSIRSQRSPVQRRLL